VTLKPCGPSDAESRSCANSATRTFPTIKTRQERGSGARDNVTKGVKGDPAAIKRVLDKLGPMPTAALEPMLTGTEPAAMPAKVG
jgi:hypothetical protein